MALKITNKKIISIFLFLLTYLFFISLKVISAESINVATSVDIGNAKPQIENIFISSTPSSLKDDYYQNITSPNTGNTTKIYINGKTTDNNGAIDIDTVKAVFYTSDAVNSYDCQENTQDCYRSNCSISSSSDISLIYNCEINLACSAKQTVKEPNQNENWKVRLAVKDKASDTSFDDSKSIEMNPFPEIADGIDNNCNGLIDEGIETANNITGVNPLFLQLINNQQNKINKPIEIAITPKPPVVKSPTEPVNAIIPAPIVLEPIATATLAEVIATTTPKENDQDGDGILDEADQCPDNVGVPSFNGCSFGIQTSNKLHTIDMAKTGACPKNNPLDLLKNINTCETNLSNVVLKAFDTEDLAFAETYGTNPERGSFSDIFKNTVGYVNKCTSDNAGDCTIGVDHPGKFLIVGAYYDNINNLIVYHGRFVSLDENTNTAQTKILRFIKVIDENKNIYYRAGKRIIIKGSQLNIDTPEYTPKSSESELYPFIFSSDEEWSINLCLDLPPGYGLQNVIDQSGKGLNPANCPTLTAKSNANGLILFKVNNKNKNLDDISFAIKTSHKNKITGEMVYNEVNGSLKNIDIEKNSVVEKYWIREIMRQEIESQQAEQRLIWLEFLTIITMIIAIFSLLMALAAWHSEKKERDNICKLFLACFYLLHLPRAKRKIIKIKVRKIFQKRK